MPYDIEVISVGADLYPILQRSADMLNRVQDQFRFHLAAPALQQRGLAFERASHQTSDLFDFLRTYRKEVGGHRPFIIAFVNVPLKGARWSNLSGSHEGGEGLAVVTTFQWSQYVKGEARFCCYYLVRYALSFVNPTIKSHNEQERQDCYFHFKERKRDIRISMDSGNICSVCADHLDNPDLTTGARRLSEDERTALKRMRDLVSGELPRAIVMKGGGVKGLAFAGALLELEKYYEFDLHVGTSAGSIAAILLASDYTPAELTQIFVAKNFREFLDAPFWAVPFNLLFRAGLYPGETFRLWIERLIRQKHSLLADVTMGGLNGAAVVYAAAQGVGTVVFASHGARSEVPAAFATRCSMSIPIFFVPKLVDGHRVYDGGLRNNFPLKRFIDDHPHSDFIGLYLTEPGRDRRSSVLSELLGIAVEGEERATVAKYVDNVVVIDTSPVGTFDFGLTPQDKAFLLSAGRVAALKFLVARQLDDGPNQMSVDAAVAELEASRRQLARSRRCRRLRRRFLWLAAVCMGLFTAAGAN